MSFNNQTMEPRADDEELMTRAAAGDSDAFAQLYHRHKEGLIAFCYRMLRNWEDAGDVFQEAFRYLHTHAARYRPTARFTTYLYHVARNMCIDILRRRKRWNLQQLDATADLLPDGGPAESPRLELEEVEAHLRKALEEVPPPYREVLHLRVVERLGYDEIAQILECPVGTVKSRLHVGLATLRTILKRKKIVE